MKSGEKKTTNKLVSIWDEAETQATIFYLNYKRFVALSALVYNKYYRNGQ